MIKYNIVILPMNKILKNMLLIMLKCYPLVRNFKLKISGNLCKMKWLQSYAGHLTKKCRRGT